MADIFAISQWFAQDLRKDTSEPELFFGGLTAARKEVKEILGGWEGTAGPACIGLSKAIILIERWTVKTGKKELLTVLQGGEITPQKSSSGEVWGLDFDGKLYSWKGGVNDEPDWLEEE